MSYQSLYRRYRSQRFDEVLGQEHVTTALKNSVREGRVAHGYLFSGPRGTGKTSTARILAKVLNCEHPVDGEPDTTCDNCKAVEEGRQVDWLQELDAASNSGVDAMRDLLGRVSMGTSGNRKVYILDEVHMLTKAASNALLKTLEEPPEHVVFVLATTEPEKVLPTIRSRTQHFDFHLLSADVLAGHVRHVIADADLGLDESAVEHVVRVGAGSARDTLSALDQVAATGGVSTLGVPVDDIIDALGARDAGAALVAVDASVRSGRDPRLLAEALIESLRDAFLVSMGAPGGAMTDTAAARAADVASALGPASLTRALELIGTASVDMRQAPDPRITLEVALVRLTRADAGDDVGALVARVEHLEQQLASGVVAAPATTADPAAPPAAAPSAPTPAPAPAPAAGPAPAPAAATVAPSGERPRRGADAARANLSQREATASPPPAPSSDAPAGSRPTLGSVRRARSEPEAAAAAPEAPAPGPAAAPEPAPAAESAPTPEPTAAPTGAPPTTAELTSAWESTVLAALKPRARALYKPGHFVDGDGRMVRFALPNRAHCDQCEGCRSEVAAALSDHFGRPVPLELVVDDAKAAPAAASPAQADVVDDDVDDAVDLDELTDAPDASVGGVAQLKDAFPGSELLEES
ncbi:DNA polymerase III subunit gamma/tau [Actinospongicola halichondriae]|uniref:DNA polymerase III subunit gamma/tau n=1 Tax=Actinospongicola halichondriae TaxID=3236844 RepID=UPI003D5979A3